MYLFNKNIIKKWKAKRVLCVLWKNISTIFTKHTQNAKTVIAQEGLNVTMKTKIKYRINRNDIMKKTEKKILLQKQNKRWLQFEDLVKSYVELENRLKTIEENFLMNDSEIN